MYFLDWIGKSPYTLVVAPIPNTYFDPTSIENCLRGKSEMLQLRKSENRIGVSSGEDSCSSNPSSMNPRVPKLYADAIDVLLRTRVCFL